MTLMKVSKCKYFRRRCLYVLFNNVNSYPIRDRLGIFTDFLFLNQYEEIVGVPFVMEKRCLGSLRTKVENRERALSKG